MAENKTDSGHQTPPATPKVGAGDYVLAVISAVFVAGGLIVLVAFSHLFAGEWVESAPPWMMKSIPPVAVGLGLLSGWQSLQKAKKKLTTQGDKPDKRRQPVN